MKKFKFLTLAFVVLLNFHTVGQTYNDSVKVFRTKYVAECLGRFKDAKQDFFEINEKYNVEAEFRILKKNKFIELKTSSTVIKKYKVYAILKFIIDGKNLELPVYQFTPINKLYKSHIFLPYNDKTNKVTSYGGGRYIDLDLKDFKNGKVFIDFNKSYNPYCAFADGYSCPVPPRENKLDIEILAGEKTPIDVH
jgi:uncharacterized protein